MHFFKLFMCYGLYLYRSNFNLKFNVFSLLWNYAYIQKQTNTLSVVQINILFISTGNTSHPKNKIVNVAIIIQKASLILKGHNYLCRDK